MKKFQLGLAVISFGLASSTVFAAPDGTVTITGKVVDQTCTLGGTNGNYTVVLPTVGKSTLATAGTTTGDTKFTINLTNCPTGNIGVYYDNTNTNITTNGRLKNTIAGGSNVEIQLLNSTKAVIDLTKDRGTQGALAVASSGGVANIDFYARYYATAAVSAATVGDVSTTATYYVVYP
ncbi:fimbrial protein [Acinetobacter rongchengensis]|uniref:Type 1 fimbrial protein n=1 Tax=Acinetobacter rongchengensis TaxID=2419601 RepID=A0A3A8F5L4_9GAMM|nr:fimbrial protein [Acinetobacter rongchengensis]RKG41036.1 type 1 fimbrial protein [Acinetobacter rongchengensis]